MNYFDALKKLRRCLYVYDDEWQAVVIAPTFPLLQYAFAEAINALKASSMKVEAVSNISRTILLERGKALQFYCAQQPTNVRGQSYTQVILVGSEDDYTPEFIDLLRHQMRSSTLDKMQFEWDFVAL